MIVYAPRALDDLRAIETYIQERNPAAAKRVLEQIKRTIEMLAVFPFVGVVVNEDGDRRIGVARYPYLVTSYSITRPKAIFSSIISGTARASRLIPGRSYRGADR